MKKFFKSLALIAVAAFGFASCEDVPAPYGLPDRPVTPTVEAIPVTCAEAKAIVDALPDGAETSGTYEITGYITDVFTNISRGQQTFWMADTKDGGKIIQAYWANLPEGVEAFKKDAKVKITGKLLKYVKDGNVTPEVKNADVVILEEGGEQGGGGDQPGTPSGDGSEKSPYNVAGALAYITTLADGDKPAEPVYTKGVVKEVVKMGTSGSIQFKMQDKSVENELLVYYCDNLGKKPFTAATDLKAGDEVIVCGTVQNFKGNTPEYNSGSYLVSLNGKTEAEGGEQGGGEQGGGEQGGGESSSTIENGGFESWSNGVPTGWQPTTSAGGATLSQSTDAHSGSYSVSVAGVASSNKRMGSKEIDLEAGTYEFAFYAKATDAEPCQVRPGYVPVTDGKVGSYAYGDYANLTTTGWTLVKHEFTLAAKTTVNLVLMNPKASSYHTSQAILVDDATLTKK